MREELQQIVETVGTHVTLHKALHSRDTVDRLYMFRKEVEKALAAFKIASIYRYKNSIILNIQRNK